MYTRRGTDAYRQISHSNLSGAEFEKAWFESVVMVLNRVKAGNFYSQMDATIKLVEIVEGLGWISTNLNDAISSQHRQLLKTIYSTCIQILNASVETKNFEYLDIVISSMSAIVQKYEVPTDDAN